MLSHDVSSSTIRTFCKAAAALAACLAFASMGCSEAPEGEVQLPSWLTEGEPTGDGSASEIAATDAPVANPFAPENSQQQNAPSATGFGTAESVETAGFTGSPLQSGGVAPTVGFSAPAGNPTGTQGFSGSQASSQYQPGQQSLGAPQLMTAPALEKAQLQLKLQPGLRLPLVKVIETELTQASGNGLPEVHKSRLELGMVISVLDQRQQGTFETKLGVQYNKIRLTRDAGGKRLEFDSSNPIVQTASSPELVAYQTMVGDGFAYWISQDNRVTSVEGFQEFMNRCLGHMPSAAQRVAMLGIEGSSGEDGLADFVDSTIGLLPYNSAKAIGETWSREVSVSRPVPMRRTEVYTLKDLDPVIATVQVAAQIAPSTSLGHQMDSEGGVRLVIQGGALTGQSEIFRDSGLPKHSQTTERLDMLVQMAGGVEFQQAKTTTTTISAYPPQTMR